MQNEQPEHALVDFVGLAKVLTNEQRIVNALEQIVVLLTPKPISATMESPEVHAAKIKALQDRVPAAKRK